MLLGIDASRSATPLRTGTETYSRRLIGALMPLVGDHRVRLYTNGTSAQGLFGSGALPPGVEVRAIPLRRLWTHGRLSAEMLLRPPELLFVPAHVLPLVSPRRCVVTIHDLGFLAFPEAHRMGDRYYLRWSTGWSARRASLVLADSAATLNDLVKRYRISPGKIRVVHLGRDPDLALVHDQDRLRAVKKRHGITTGQYLLYLGTLQPRKNLARLISAFAQVAGRPGLEECQLVLAGKLGWLSQDLLPLAARLGLAERILFPGYIADEDLAPLMSGATAFLFPSLYEGFGFPVLEAQSCGVAVMTSNNSSLPEVAGDAALLVDPLDEAAIAEAIVRLVTDAGLRAELSRRGLENVKRFSWEKCARETLAALEDAAAGRI